MAGVKIDPAEFVPDQGPKGVAIDPAEFQPETERPSWLTKGAPKPAPVQEYPTDTPGKLLAELHAPPVTSVPEASLRGGASAAFPWVDEATGAVRALAGTRDIRQVPEAYRRERDSERERTAAAANEHPDAFYGTGALSLVGTSFIPGAGAERGIGNAARLTTRQAALRGALVGGAHGAVDAAGRSEADLTRGEVVPFLQDVGVGAGTGAVIGVGLAGGANWLVGKAEERAQRAIVRQATEGATPTHARRLAGRQGESAEQVVNFVRANPEVKKALGNQAKVAEVTDKIVERAAGETKPIYQDITEQAGPVPVAAVVRHLDAEIKGYASHAGDENFADALRSVRENVIKAEAAKGADWKSATWSHQDLRGWVTRLLKDEQRTMGSISETRAYEVKDAVHRAADNFLRDELDTVAAVHPQIAPKVDHLRKLNGDISTALRMNQAAENAGARAYYANRNPMLSAIAGGAAGTALGTGAGPIAAGSAYIATEVAPRVARAAGRGVDKVTSSVVRAAEKPSWGTPWGEATGVGARGALGLVQSRLPIVGARVGADQARQALGSGGAKKPRPQSEAIEWGDDSAEKPAWE